MILPRTIQGLGFLIGVCVVGPGCFGPYALPGNADLPAPAIRSAPQAVVVQTFELDSRDARTDLVAALAERGVEARVGEPGHDDLVVEGRLTSDSYDPEMAEDFFENQAEVVVPQFVVSLFTLFVYGGVIPWAAPITVDSEGELDLVIRGPHGYPVAAVGGPVGARQFFHYFLFADTRSQHEVRRRSLHEHAVDIVADGLRDRLAEPSATAAAEPGPDDPVAGRIP